MEKRSDKSYFKKKLRNKLFSIFVCAFMKKAGIDAVANISQLL